MNQFLDIAQEAYSGLETFSRLAFPPHRRVVQRMSAGPALYGPTVILVQNANLAVVADQSSKVCRDESINASTAILAGGGEAVTLDLTISYLKPRFYFGGQGPSKCL
jgi:hypothetical protein